MTALRAASRDEQEQAASAVRTCVQNLPGPLVTPALSGLTWAGPGERVGLKVIQKLGYPADGMGPVLVDEFGISAGVMAVGSWCHRLPPSP